MWLCRANGLGRYPAENLSGRKAAQRGSSAPSSSCRQIAAAAGVSRMPCRKKPVAMISPAMSPGPPGPQPGPAGARCPVSRAGPWRWPRAVPVRRRRAPAAGRPAAAGRRPRRKPAAHRGRCPPRCAEGVLPLGGTDHHCAVLPGNDVDRHPADQAPDGGGQQRPQPAGTRSRRISPWTGRSGSAVRRAGRERGRARAVGHDGFPARTPPPPARLTPADAPRPARAARRRATAPSRLRPRRSAARGAGDPGEQHQLRGPPGGRRECRRRRRCPGSAGVPAARASRTVSGSTPGPHAAGRSRRSASARRSAASAPTARVGVVRLPGRRGPASAGSGERRRRSRATGARTRA